MTGLQSCETSCSLGTAFLHGPTQQDLGLKGTAEFSALKQISLQETKKLVKIQPNPLGPHV